MKPAEDDVSCGGRTGEETIALGGWRARATWMRLIHHCIGHPLLALTNGARWAIRFHDWTEDTPALRIYVPPGSPISPYRTQWAARKREEMDITNGNREDS